MSSLSWREAAIPLLRAPQRGLVHDTDLVAALARSEPDRFRPTMTGITPHESTGGGR